MSCGIYKFENNLNHKVYIGLTINLQTRYEKHLKNIKDATRQEVFYQALRKYGIENFTYEILEQFENYDKELLSDLENYYINKYNSLVPNGYNMIPGGYNGAGLAKGKVVEQYNLTGILVNTFPSAHEANRQTGINYSDICACCRNANNKSTAGGYQWKYQDSDKEISTNAIIVGQQKQVYQFNEQNELIASYLNLIDAQEKTGINKALICQACKIPTRQAGHYYWSYDINYQIPTQKLQGLKNQKKVSQYDKNGNLIHIYDSVAQAASDTNINKGNISSVCLGKRKTAGGYVWKYN